MLRVTKKAGSGGGGGGSVVVVTVLVPGTIPAVAGTHYFVDETVLAVGNVNFTTATFTAGKRFAFKITDTTAIGPQANKVNVAPIAVGNHIEDPANPGTLVGVLSAQQPGQAFTLETNDGTDLWYGLGS